jgi:hypothetical protein
MSQKQENQDFTIEQEIFLSKNTELAKNTSDFDKNLEEITGYEKESYRINYTLEEQDQYFILLEKIIRNMKNQVNIDEQKKHFYQMLNFIIPDLIQTSCYENKETQQKEDSLDYKIMSIQAIQMTETTFQYNIAILILNYENQIIMQNEQNNFSLHYEISLNINKTENQNNIEQRIYEINMSLNKISSYKEQQTGKFQKQEIFKREEEAYAENKKQTIKQEYPEKIKQEKYFKKTNPEIKENNAQKTSLNYEKQKKEMIQEIPKINQNYEKQKKEIIQEIPNYFKQNPAVKRSYVKPSISYFKPEKTQTTTKTKNNYAPIEINYIKPADRKTTNIFQNTTEKNKTNYNTKPLTSSYQIVPAINYNTGNAKPLKITKQDPIQYERGNPKNLMSSYQKSPSLNYCGLNTKPLTGSYSKPATINYNRNNNFSPLPKGNNGIINLTNSGKGKAYAGSGK